MCSACKAPICLAVRPKPHLMASNIKPIRKKAGAPTFLIIDDDQAVLRLLAEIVSAAFKNARVLTAGTGRSGLELAQGERPDVILLDMLLPDISGLEVCRQVKNNKLTCRIPVIFITSVCKESKHRVSGLDTGADYYLHKPFDNNELVAQLKATLRIKQSEDSLRAQKLDLEEAFRKQTEELRLSREALAQKVEELEKLVESQTQELVRADRLAAMGILSAGIAHEVNNPNTFIMSNLQTFRLFWDQILKALDQREQCSEADLQRMEFIRQEMPGLLQGMEEGARRIKAIVLGMKNYVSGNNADNRVVDLRDVVEAALRLIHNQIKHDVEVQTDFAPDLPRVFGSEQLICQVFVNLILNAANVMREHRGEGLLRIKGCRVDGQSVVSFQDNGPGMDHETMRNLFNPFFTMRRGRGGTGLGLFVSHGIIKGHGGTIDVASQPGQGAVFHVRLPAIEKEQTLTAEVENTAPELAAKEQ